jgi:hypothetical protein
MLSSLSHLSLVFPLSSLCSLLSLVFPLSLSALSLLSLSLFSSQNSVLQLVAHTQLVTLHDSSSAIFQASVQVLRLVRTVNIAFDLMYCLDALLYGVVWVEREKANAIVVPVFRFASDFGDL